MQSYVSCVLILGVLMLASIAYGADHSCPDERPYPRGTTACDSCPWEETLEKYQAGELSTTRESEVFEHSIRVSVVCDQGRPIDVDDVFEKIAETERVLKEVLDPAIRLSDGDEVLLEVITGICDYGDGVDDCVMHTVCRQGGTGCDVSQGQSFAYVDGIATHATFVPYLPEGIFWWAEGNRYGNLQHEYTHLLDYTYLRIDAQRGTDLDWWVEGLPQFIQWKILNDQLSWSRGNDDARLLEIFTHRWNTRDYYDGMRVFAFLDSVAPYWLEVLAREVQNGIYVDAESHLAWHSLLGFIASRHESAYRQFIEMNSGEEEGSSRTIQDVIGVVEGISHPEYADTRNERRAK